jgi:methylenetetrahydrofolate dehydrogenase (NADP+)/methenyltetrahydrofolate cyclohydrolase
MQLIDGKATANQIRQEIKTEVESLIASGKRAPHLAAILVGEDGGSITYVNAKINDCKEIGFRSSLVKLEASITEEELLLEVEKLNNQDDLDGFIVQLPLPSHINEQKVINAIYASKDVDGFHPENFGRMALGMPTMVPATPLGITELLRRYEIETSGKHCVVVGRSNIVGLPMSILMGQNSATGNTTVTLTHSRTQNLEEICRSADILIAAIGKPGFITSDMVKEGAIVIDVGSTRVADASRKSGFRLRGDVDFDQVAEKCSFITPVPGGVGPMTRAGLLQNLMVAYRQRFA